MDNYETADQIRDYTKKSKRCSGIANTLWALCATGIILASGYRVKEAIYDCKAKDLYDKLNI